MSVDNFENQIKAKLEARSLKPSDSAWERLSLQLDAAPQKNSSSRRFWYYGIAASFIGLCVAVTFLMTPSEYPINNAQQLVETPTQELDDKPKSSNEDLDNTEPVDIQDLQPAFQQSKALRVAEVVPMVKPEQEKSKGDGQIRRPFEVKPALDETPVYKDSADQLLAEIEGLMDNPDLSSDAEIEQLLFQAQNRLALQSSKVYEGYAVDAQALLRDVETDMDMSFRERVLESLITHYRMLKTAVADRNN